MANSNPACGLVPLPDAKGAVITSTTRIPISSSNTKALGMYSPVYVTSGEVRGVVTYVDGTESVSGSVTGLYTAATGGKAVGTVPASTGGYYAEITTSPDQRFRIRVSGTGMADADRGKMYSLTEETLTASTDGLVSGFSKRELDSTTEQTSGEQFIFLGRTGSIRNDASTDDMEVVVKINPANFVQA